MAARFYVIKEKGSVGEPPPSALVIILFAWAATLFIFQNSPFWALGFFILEWVFIALIMQNPFRQTLSKIMHLSRYSPVISLPTDARQRWSEANKETYAKAGFSSFHGNTTIPGTINKEDGK